MVNWQTRSDEIKQIFEWRSKAANMVYCIKVVGFIYAKMSKWYLTKQSVARTFMDVQKGDWITVTLDLDLIDWTKGKINHWLYQHYHKFEVMEIWRK